MPHHFNSWGSYGPETGIPQSGIYIDYDPANLSLSDTDPISTLTDSVAGRNGTASGTQRPVYRTNQINGLPAVSFSAPSAQWFDLPNLSALTSGTVHIVVKANADPAASASSAGLWRLGTAGDQSLYGFNGIIYDGFGSTARKETGNPSSALDAWRIVSIYSAANDWQIFIDGVSHFSTVTNTVGFHATPLLGSSDTALFWFDGFIGRTILYSTKQSSTDFNRTITELQSIYAL